MYYIGKFYKKRGTFMEERRGYLQLETAMREAYRMVCGARSILTRVRCDRDGILVVYDGNSDIEVPGKFNRNLALFSDGVDIGEQTE